MKYAIRNDDGDHVGVNRSLTAQRALRREGALDRAQFRATLTAEQQLQRINERPGKSIKERIRLLVAMGTEESHDAAASILLGLCESKDLENRKLGNRLGLRYEKQLKLE